MDLVLNKEAIQRNSPLDKNLTVFFPLIHRVIQFGCVELWAALKNIALSDIIVKKIAGLHAIADAIARNAVAVVDKTDVGCLTPEELDEAASYAISEFKRFRTGYLPKIKEASIADSPLFTLANEIDKESDEIAKENWLKENNPEYLEYLESEER